MSTRSDADAADSTVRRVIAFAMPPEIVHFPHCDKVQMKLDQDDVDRLIRAAAEAPADLKSRVVLIPPEGETGVLAMVLGASTLVDPVDPDRTFPVILGERVHFRLPGGAPGMADFSSPPRINPRSLELEIGILRIVVQNYVSINSKLTVRCRLNRLAKQLEQTNRWELLVDQIANEVLTKTQDRFVYLRQRESAKRIMQVVQVVAHLTESLESAAVLRSRDKVSNECERVPIPSSQNGAPSWKELRQRILTSLPPGLVKPTAQALESLLASKTEAATRKMRFLEEYPWASTKRPPLDTAKIISLLEDGHVGHPVVKRHLANVATRISFVEGRGGVPMERPMLLFGPPGVGKTSLAAAFAKALQRPFAKINMGSVSDVIELVGTTEQYSNSSPGVIMRTLAKCGAPDPVILLDELDKMGTSTHNGDPVGVLLDILGGGQERCFTDTFLGIPFNIRSVIWIATANDVSDLSDALVDRMQVIYVQPYEMEEKLTIARDVLVPQMLSECCIEPTEVTFTDDGLDAIVSRYHCSSGVRDLVAGLRGVITAAMDEVSQGRTPVRIDHEFLMTHS